MSIPQIALLALAAMLPLPASALLLGDAESGAKLHAANCRGCHDTSVYTRHDRRIRTIEGLIGQVNFCNRQLDKKLTRDQVNDIVKYLNDSYYRFE